MKPYIPIILFYFCCFGSVAQTLELSGRITHSTTGESLPGTTIIIKSGDRILGFGYSDDLGNYSVDIKRNGLVEVKLEVKSMGFAKQEKNVPLSEENTYKNDFLLEEEFESLSTVVISPDKKIELKTDTVAYKVSHFIDKTERTVEDVLKNLPGIEIDENGNIKAQGQNIAKILIEGDDLADSNYKVISQNLDAQVLDKVEVISNYDENPVLRQFLSSNAVVLNLKLQDKAKSILFGNLEAGAGIEDRYLADLNLGLIRPEIKFLNLGNLNNTGKTAGDQLNNYIFGQQGFNDFNQNFEMKNSPLVHLNGSSIMVDDQFYIENNSLANNLLVNRTLKEKTKLRASLFFYNDSFGKEYANRNEYFIEPENIVFTEANAFDFDNLNFSNEVEISHPISENDFINFKNSFKVLNEDTHSRLIFNNEEVIDQHLKDKNIDLESNLKYTRKIKDGAAVFYLYLGSKNLEQEFTISPNTFQEETNEFSMLHSYNESSLNYQGFQTNLVFKKNQLSYSFTGGILNLSEVLKSEVFEQGRTTRTGVDSLSGLNEAASFATNIKFKASYPIFRSVHFNTKIDAIYNNYENDADSANFFFINPDVNLSSRTGIGNFRLGYSYDSEIPRLRYFFDNYIVQSYRGLGTGTESVEPISKHQYVFGYTFSRPEKRILFSTSLSYTNFENQLVTNNFLSQDMNISQYRYAAGQNFLIFNTGFTTYVDQLSSSIKIGLTHTAFERPSVINNRELVIRNQNSNIYVRGTTYFRGAYNMKFSAGYSVGKGKIQGNEVRTDRYNFRIENILRISDKIFGNFRNELFLIDSNLYESSTADIEYRPEDSDWVFGLRAQNLFNTRNYVFATVNDYQEIETIFKAVPRYFLLYGKLRF